MFNHCGYAMFQRIIALSFENDSLIQGTSEQLASFPTPFPKRDKGSGRNITLQFGGAVGMLQSPKMRIART